MLQFQLQTYSARSIGEILISARLVITIVATLSMETAVALAEQPATGVWQRDTGTARVKIAPCDEKYCGTIVWVRDADSPTKVGMRVFWDMEPERDNVWSGKAFNPENRQTYEGTLTVTGDKMVTTGCILGKLICSSAYWRRVR